MNGEDMINNLQDRVSKLESIAQQNRDDIKDLREKQFNDHDTLLSVKADTKYIKENMIEKIKMETRRYAKRQITWFKKCENIKWIDGLDDIQNNIEVILEEYCGK